MRSRASLSASSAGRLQLFAAAAISAGGTAMPILSRSTRSNFFENSVRAASPLATMSAIMARTACSTSCDASRLVARKARKRSGKSAERVSRRSGMTGQWRAGGSASTLPAPGVVRLDQTRLSVAVLAHRWHILRMLGPDPAIPDRAEIGQLAFEAFDLESHRRVAGKRQGYHAAGGVGLRELDRQQVENQVLVGRAHVTGLKTADSLESQR